MRRTFNPWLLVMLIILGIFVFNQFSAGTGSGEINFSTFTELLDDGRVASVTVDRSSGDIEGELVSESQVTIAGEPQTIRAFSTTTIITDSLLASSRNASRRHHPQPARLINYVISFLPILILIGVLVRVHARGRRTR